MKNLKNFESFYINESKYKTRDRLLDQIVLDLINYTRDFSKEIDKVFKTRLQARTTFLFKMFNSIDKTDEKEFAIIFDYLEQYMKDVKNILLGKENLKKDFTKDYEKIILQ